MMFYIFGAWWRFYDFTGNLALFDWFYFTWRLPALTPFGKMPLCSAIRPRRRAELCSPRDVLSNKTTSKSTCTTHLKHGALCCVVRGWNDHDDDALRTMRMKMGILTLMRPGDCSMMRVHTYLMQSLRKR